MTPSKRFFNAALIIAPFLLLFPKLGAGNPHYSFVMTASEPVIAGTKLLAPGTYVWQLLESQSEHHSVQITDKITGRVEATVIGMPTYRDQPSGKNVLEFWETPVGAPRAVRSWFAPGANYGQEFAYPKKMLAAFTHRDLEPDSPQAAILSPQIPHLKARRSPVLLASIHSASQQVASPSTGGSWAIISDAKTVSPKPNAPKRKRTIWEALANLPLTATLAPLIGLIGTVALGLFGLSYRKKKSLAALPRG